GGRRATCRSIRRGLSGPSEGISRDAPRFGCVPRFSASQDLRLSGYHGILVRWWLRVQNGLKASVLFFYATPGLLQPPPPHLFLDPLPARRFAGLRRHP